MEPKKAKGKECSDWKAWYDMEPPGPETLHVSGECTFPTGGYKVTLRPAVPQGINPDIYILEKVIHEPTGPTTQVISNVSAHYREKTKYRYKQVQIRPDGVTVDVKQAH